MCAHDSRDIPIPGRSKNDCTGRNAHNISASSKLPVCSLYSRTSSPYCENRGLPFRLAPTSTFTCICQAFFVEPKWN